MGRTKGKARHPRGAKREPLERRGSGHQVHIVTVGEAETTPESL